MTDLGIDVGIDNPTEPETCAKKRDRTSTPLRVLEPESSANATNSRETSRTQCQELPENTASGQGNRDSKSLDAPAHLAAIIAAWDAWRTSLGDDARRFDEDIAWERLCSAIESARSQSPRVWTQLEIDSLSSVCWHCGDVMTGLYTRCDKCPAPGDCDDDECEVCIEAGRKAAR